MWSVGTERGESAAIDGAAVRKRPVFAHGKWPGEATSSNDIEQVG